MISFMKNLFIRKSVSNENDSQGGGQGGGRGR
jgi:hypothetical protein